MGFSLSVLFGNKREETTTEYDEHFERMLGIAVGTIVVSALWIVAILVNIEATKTTLYSAQVDHSLEMKEESSDAQVQKSASKEDDTTSSESAKKRPRRVPVMFKIIQVVSVGSLMLLTYLLLVVSNAPMIASATGSIVVFVVFLRYQIGDEIRRQRTDRLFLMVSLFLLIASMMSLATYSMKSLSNGEIYEGPARIVGYDETGYLDGSEHDPSSRTDLQVQWGKEWGCPRSGGKVCESDVKGIMCTVNPEDGGRRRLEDSSSNADEESEIEKLEEENEELQKENEELEEELQEETLQEEEEEELAAEEVEEAQTEEEEDAAIYNEDIEVEAEEELEIEEAYTDAYVEMEEEELTVEEENETDPEEVEEDAEYIEELDEAEQEIDAEYDEYMQEEEDAAEEYEEEAEEAEDKEAEIEKEEGATEEEYEEEIEEVHQGGGTSSNEGAQKEDEVYEENKEEDVEEEIEEGYEEGYEEGVKEGEAEEEEEYEEGYEEGLEELEYEEEGEYEEGYEDGLAEGEYEEGYGEGEYEEEEYEEGYEEGLEEGLEEGEYEEYGGEEEDDWYWDEVTYEYDDDFYEPDYWAYDWDSAWGEYACEDLFDGDVAGLGYDVNTPAGEDDYPFIKIYGSCKTCSAYVLDYFAEEEFESVVEYKQQAILYFTAALCGFGISFLAFIKYKVSPTAENQVELLGSDGGVLA